MAEFVEHVPCPKCQSSDAGARYSDDSFHCHKCDHHINAPGTGKGLKTKQKKEFKPIGGHYEALPDRHLREDTLKRFKYQVGTRNGELVEIANFKDEKGNFVGQKFRTPDKEFAWSGEGSDLLYGMWRWGKGKSITITEGEHDCHALDQAWDGKWPVVSLPSGCNSVQKTFKRCYDYLNNFDSIVLMFDEDAPGRKAVEEAVTLLPAGKVKIASLPEKDANDVLKKHGPQKLIEAYWNAKPYRPDGIVCGEDLNLDDLMSESAKGYTLRMPLLQERLLGLRKGEITLITAGSGIGKSTMCRQLGYELKVDHDITLGNVYLEEKNKKTAQAYIALHNNVPLGKLRYNPAIITPEQWADGKRAIVDGMHFYDHFGSLESNRLLSKLHYMATVLKVDFIILDHISIVTSGMESGSEGERKDIDILMTRLRSLCEETGVGILAVVHLKRVTGKNFNEGAQVSLTDLRGSGSLEQLSDNVLSLERNQQDEKNKDTMLGRVLKCRETGDTGEADTMLYRRDTGKIERVDPEVKSNFEPTSDLADGEEVPF